MVWHLVKNVHGNQGISLHTKGKLIIITHNLAYAHVVEKIFSSERALLDKMTATGRLAATNLV